MKKRISLFLVFFMVLGLLAFGVAAEENGVVISLGNYEVDAGEEFWVNFSVENGTNLFNGFDFTLNTDDSVVAFDREYDDFTGEYNLNRQAGNIWRDAPSIVVNAENPGFINAAGGATTPIKEDGVFFKVKMIAVGEPGDTVDLTFEGATAIGLVDGATTVIPSTYIDGNITIAEKIEPVTGITLNRSEAFLYDGAHNFKLVPTIMPADATNRNVTWTSSDETVAKITEVECSECLLVVIDPVGEGIAIITATTEDGGLQATCTVRVLPLFGDVTGSGTISVGDAITILRDVVGMSELDDFYKVVGDVNGDGKIDVSDAIIILRYIVGLIDNFPLVIS